jgi:hypothetical protein
MPPRKSTTRCLPRAPKLKEAKVGEGYSPDVVRQLEFATKVESFIRTYTKKEFAQPPAFGDTEASIGSKIILPQWGDLFNRINWEDYLEFITHNDADVRTLDDRFF